MKLNAKMLCEAAAERDVLLLGRWRRERALRFPCFYDGDAAQLTPGGVYLAAPEQLPHPLPERQDILWVTWGTAPPAGEPDSPLLYFRCQSTPWQVLNQLQSIFLRFSAWEDDLSRLLRCGSSVKKIIERSEPFFSHPLCVVDSSGNYLGYSASFMEKNRRFFLENEAGAPSAAPPLFFDRHRDAIAPLMNRDYTLGTFYMIHDALPFSETEQQLFDLLSDELLQAVQNLSMLSGLYHNTFKHQLEKMFSAKQTEQEALYGALAQWGGRRGDTFLCYKVKASHINQKINAEHICSIFESVLEGSVAFWYDAILVVLADVTRSGIPEAKLHEKMEGLLQQLRMKAGVSLLFTDLETTWYHFRQACCAFEEGYPRHPDETLYFFQQYVPDYILHHAAGEFPRRFLLDGGMQRLREHDGASSVSYLDTLDAYFQCRMNMSQTAELLKIHRTSLNSRMQKIWECLDHEPTREYLLYLQIVLALLRRRPGEDEAN